MRYTSAQILENRKIVSTYLQKKSLRKARNQLRNENGGRCCLGHMCDALGVSYKKSTGLYLYGKEYTYLKAPNELVDMLGLFDKIGSIEGVAFNETSLAAVNDETRTSPQKIGKYLEENIVGGPNTPWKKLRVK